MESRFKMGLCSKELKGIIYTLWKIDLKWEYVLMNLKELYILDGNSI